LLLVILFAAAAPRTHRLRFGPEVTHVILRDPTLIAQQAATLDELTGGRVGIVFSIGNPAMLDQYQVTWQGSRPLAPLREAHQVMRRFLTDGVHVACAHSSKRSPLSVTASANDVHRGRRHHRAEFRGNRT
jgi:alkanesulfonate monooxygenase SsuD/methylene tetrahydromethanopterin reductase-like flavin-dependent oxidoreductase (luciferase family)